jgi:hypothetical protein
MKDLSFDRIEAALRDGSLESAEKHTVAEYLRATHGIEKGQNPAFHVRLEQASQTLRHLMALADARESNHQTIFWARIGGWAAVIAAVFAGVAAADVVLRWIRAQ